VDSSRKDLKGMGKRFIVLVLVYELIEQNYGRSTEEQRERVKGL